MHKTGSSSIQRSLSGADDLGPNHCFVSLGRRTGNLSGQLITAFADEPWDADPNLRRGFGREALLEQRPGIRARLIEQVAAAGERTAVVSAEAVSGFSEPEFGRLVRTLERAGGGVSAVGYVRAPAERMASVFQQRLRGGHDSFDPAEFYPGYRRLEAFDSVLGREQVSLWKFDPARFPDGDVVLDFCARLGIDIAADDVVRVNEGLSLPAISILFAYRRYGPGFGVGPEAVRENRALIEALEDVPGAKFAYHESVVTPVLEANRDDLAWIENRLGEELGSSPPGTEGVRSGDELLEIDPGAVGAFVAAVQARFGIELPSSATERVDADPHAVAETVRSCRDSIRELLFGSSPGEAAGATGDRTARSSHRSLVPEAAGSAGSWRCVDGDSIVLAPTSRQPTTVRLDATGVPEAEDALFTARVHAGDAPVVLRLSIGEDGEEGRMLDEITLVGRADRWWKVPIPHDSGDGTLRLSCVLTADGSKGRRGRVRVARPTLRLGTRLPPRSSHRPRSSREGGAN